MNPHPASKSCLYEPGRSRIRQEGVGLVEVLVAVLVLSIGLLGVAAIQTRTLANNNSAMARSMATVASYSILEAMRADQSNAIAGAYNTTVNASNCPDTGSFAQTQLNLWCKELGNTLGAVDTTTGQVACTAIGDCTITVTYNDSRIGVMGTNAQQVVTQGML